MSKRKTKSAQPAKSAAPAKNSAKAPSVGAPPSAEPSLAWGFVALPPGAGPALRHGLAVAGGVLFLFAVLLPSIAGRLILVRQRSLPESAIPLALADLNAGRERAALDRVDAILRRDAVLRFEGRGESAMALEYDSLARALLDAGLPARARAVAWRAVRVYHQENRSLEFLPAWETILRASASDAPAVAVAAFEVLLAHGKATALAAIEPLAEVAPEFATALRVHAEAAKRVETAAPEVAARTAPPKISNRAKAAIPEPARAAMAAKFGRALAELSGEHRPASAALAAHAKSARAEFPDRIEFNDLARAARDGSGAARTLEALPAESIAIFDMERLATIATPSTPARKFRKLGTKPGSTGAAFHAGGAAELAIDVPGDVPRFHVAVSGDALLGVGPIVLVSVDGGEAFPLHVDSTTPRLRAVEIPLAKGRRVVRIEYVNDFAETVGGRPQDRNLELFRIAIAR